MGLSWELGLCWEEGAIPLFTVLTQQGFRGALPPMSESFPLALSWFLTGSPVPFCQFLEWREGTSLESPRDESQRMLGP